MQIDKIVVGIPLVLLLSASAYPAKLYLDSTYVKVSDYRQSVQQQREWSLRDRINEVKDRAAIERRALTAAEKRQVERWQSEIRKLGGDINVVSNN